MTRHLPHWARIQRLRSEHIFGVCVVTFDKWHLVILFDLVQGIMLASQGKVLSPGNEGSMSVIVHVSIFPQFCLISRPAGYHWLLCGALGLISALSGVVPSGTVFSRACLHFVLRAASSASACHCASCCVCPRVSCYASLALSPLCGATLRCAGLVRLHRAVRLVCLVGLVFVSCLPPFSPPPPFFFVRCGCRRRLLGVVSFCFLPSSFFVSCFFLVFFSFSSPPPLCVRSAFCCLVSPRSVALPFLVLRCLVAMFCAACRAVVSRLGGLWAAVFSCVLLCCAMLLVAASCCARSSVVASRCVARVVACRLVLVCVAVCCVVLLGAVLRRVVACCSARLCVPCRGVFVRAVVRRCALCCVRPGVSCCVFPVLSVLCGVTVRCAGAVASCCLFGLCCFWRLVLLCVAVCCAVSCGVVLCCCALCRVVLCPAVSCCGIRCGWLAALLCGAGFCAAQLPLGALLPCAVPRRSVLWCGAVVSCPAALFALMPVYSPTLKTTAKFLQIFLRLLKVK